MTDYLIQAKPTKYAGITFRSRLEARWAVFFDAIDVRWEYEPETFSTEWGDYTPDFRLGLRLPVHGRLGETYDRETGTYGRDLTNFHTYVEVKPTAELLAAEGSRLTMMVEYQGPCAGGLILLGQVPDTRRGTPWHPYLSWAKGVSTNALEWLPYGSPPYLPQIDNADCNQGEDGFSREALEWLNDLVCSDSPSTFLANAYSAARNERFGLHPAG